MKLPPETVAAARAIELRLPGGRSLVIRPGFDRSTLRELLTTLESCPSSGEGREANGADRGSADRARFDAARGQARGGAGG